MAGLATLISLWAFFRLPETLHPEYRRELTFKSVTGGFGIVFTNRLALFYGLAGMFLFGAMFGFVSSSQQIFVDIFGLGALPRRLRGHGGNDGCLVVPQFAHRQALRHAPAEPFRADRLYQRQHPPRRLQPGGLHAALAVSSAC